MGGGWWVMGGGGDGGGCKYNYHDRSTLSTVSIPFLIAQGFSALFTIKLGEMKVFYHSLN